MRKSSNNTVLSFRFFCSPGVGSSLAPEKRNNFHTQLTILYSHKICQVSLNLATCHLLQTLCYRSATNLFYKNTHKEALIFHHIKQEKEENSHISACSEFGLINFCNFIFCIWSNTPENNDLSATSLTAEQMPHRWTIFPSE